MNTNFNPRRGRPFPSFIILVSSLVAVLLACIAAAPTPPAPSASSLVVNTNNVLQTKSTNFFQQNTGHLSGALSTMGITPGGGGPGGAATNAVTTVGTNNVPISTAATNMQFLDSSFLTWLATNVSGKVFLQPVISGLARDSALTTVSNNVSTKAGTNAPTIFSPIFAGNKATFNTPSNSFAGDLFITGSILDLDSLTGVGDFHMDGNGYFGGSATFGGLTTNRSDLLSEHYFATTNGGNGKKFFRLSARTNVFSIDAVYDTPGTSDPFVQFYKNTADGSPMFTWFRSTSNKFDGEVYFAAPGGSGSSIVRNATTGKLTLTDAPVLDGVSFTNLNASQLLSGTVPTARLGSGTANSSTYLRGDNTWATIPWSSISSTPTTLAGYSISDAASASGLVSATNNLDASKLTVGTVGTARLGSGTANATTYFRGDQTWQSLLTNYIREVIFTNDTANRYTTNTSGITFWLATNLMAYGSGGGTPGATNNQVLNGTTAFTGPATNQTIAVLTGNLMQGSNANWTLTTTSAGPLHFAASNFVENAWYLLTISNSVATSFGLITNGGGGQVQYRGWRGIDANSVTRVNMIKTYGVLTAYIDAAPGVTSVAYSGTNVVVDGTLAPFQRVILTNAAGVVVNVLVTNAVTDATTVQFHQGNVGNIQLSFISNAMLTRTNSSGTSLTTNATALDIFTFVPLTNGVVGANRIGGFQ